MSAEARGTPSTFAAHGFIVAVTTIAELGDLDAQARRGDVVCARAIAVDR